MMAYLVNIENYIENWKINSNKKLITYGHTSLTILVLMNIGYFENSKKKV